MTTEEYYQFTAIFFDLIKEEPIAGKKAVPLKISKPRILKNGSWTTPGDTVEPGFLRALMNQPDISR